MIGCFWGENKRKIIIATLIIDDIEHAIPLAETLYECGIHSLEITLRTDCAVRAIEQIVTHCPAISVGAGTVLSSKQLHAVKEAGAAFAVSPGFNVSVVEAAMKIGFPFAPGVCTPSEIEIAIEHGCKTFKFFPAEQIGGINYLDGIASPYLHLGIRFIPLGGINENNFMSYLRKDYVTAVGGSWLAPRHLIKEQRWLEIRKRCINAKIELPQTHAVSKNVIVDISTTAERKRDEHHSNIW